jgi:hypothetical protein
MAHEATTYNRGEMDIQEQAATYEFVMKLTKWGSLAIASLLLMLVLLFCTGTGAPGSVLCAIVLGAAGVVFLREKPEAH